MTNAIIQRTFLSAIFFFLLSVADRTYKQVGESLWEYSKVPKFSDARKLCCNLPKIQNQRSNLKVFHRKDANRIANSEDLIRLLLEKQSDLGLYCLPTPICPKTKGHYGNLIIIQS